MKRYFEEVAIGLAGFQILCSGDRYNYRDHLKGHTVNLLTIESSFWPGPGPIGYEIGIVWGRPEGAANWLITPEQFAVRDFSQVIFESAG